MSGKKGRPPIDHLSKQNEIYIAVSPLILAYGPSKLSMRDAAATSYLSLGGLCHYFSTKRELVFHGLNPDAITRICHDFGDLLDSHLDWQPKQCQEAYLDHAIKLLDFVRPSVYAAIEIGTQNLDVLINGVMKADIGEYVFKRLLPNLPEQEFHKLGRALRRVGLGAAFDPTTTPDEIKNQLQAVLNGYSFELN